MSSVGRMIFGSRIVASFEWSNGVGQSS
jgi:hypothetical protein